MRFVCVIRVPKCPVCPEDPRTTIAKDVCGLTVTVRVETVQPAAPSPPPPAPAVLLF